MATLALFKPQAGHTSGDWKSGALAENSNDADLNTFASFATNKKDTGYILFDTLQNLTGHIGDGLGEADSMYKTGLALMPSDAIMRSATAQILIASPNVIAEPTVSLAIRYNGSDVASNSWTAGGSNLSPIVKSTSYNFPLSLEYSLSNVLSKLAMFYTQKGNLSIGYSTISFFEIHILVYWEYPVYYTTVSNGSCSSAKLQSCDAGGSISYKFTANSGYTLNNPTITFNNGVSPSYTWNASTGTLTFSNIRSAINFNITFKADKVNKIYVGNKQPKVYVGNTEVKAVYVGNTKIYG